MLSRTSLIHLKTVWLILLASTSLHAAISTWNGNADTNYQNGNNWSGTAVPAVSNTAQFQGTVTTNQPTLTASGTIAGLQFTTPTGGWTLGGAPFSLTINAGGISTVGQTSGVDTISANVILGSVQIWIAGTGGTLSISGAITGSNGKNLTIGTSGNTGTVALSASNTYTGTTTVSYGTLALNAGGAISDSAITVNTNGLLTESVVNALSGTASLAVSSGTISLSLANNYTGPTSAGTTGILILGDANAVQNSTVSINANNAVQLSSGIGSFNFGGLSGNSALALQDIGSNAVALTVGGNNASTTYTGVLSGSGSLFKSGIGTLTLTGAGNTFTGGFTVNGGAVDVQNSGSQLGTGMLTINNALLQVGNSLSSNLLTGPSSIVLNSGTVQERDSSNRTQGGSFVVTGTSGFITTKNNTSNTITITYGPLSIGNAQLNVTNTGFTDGSASVAGVALGATTLTGNPTFNLINVPDGSSAAVMDLTLGALNDGGTARTISISTTGPGTGRFDLNTTATSLVDGTVIMVSGTTELFIGANNGQNAIGTLTAVTLTAPASLTPNNSAGSSGAAVVLGALNGTGNLILLNFNTFTIGSTNNLSGTFSGLITGGNGSTNTTFIKAGTGSLTLSNTSNTYSAQTFINAGTLYVAGNDNVGQSTKGIFGGNGNNSSNVYLGATSGTFNASLLTTGNFTIGHAINVRAGSSGIMTLGGNAPVASTFTGGVGTTNGAVNVDLVALAGGTTSFTTNAFYQNSGALSVTIGDSAHSGTVVFGLSSMGYSGTTSITNGATLQIGTVANGGSGSSIGNSSKAASNLVFSGGDLQYAGLGGSTDRLFTFDFNGGAIDSSGTSNGALAFTNTGALVASGAGDRTLTLEGSSTGANSLAAGIPDPSSGSTSVAKSGVGNWALTGTSIYSGSTTVNAGLLTVTGSLANTTSGWAAFGGTLEVDGLLNHSATTTVDGALQGIGSVGAVTVDSGGTVDPGLASTSNSAGNLTAFGSLLLTDSSSIFSIRLGVATAADNDELTMASGNVTLNNATLNLTMGGAYANQAPGFIYVLINGQPAGSTITGEFAQGISMIAAGELFDIVYNENATDTGSGNDVLLIAEGAAIPEPGAWAMFMGAGAMLLAFQRASAKRPGKIRRVSIIAETAKD